MKAAIFDLDGTLLDSMGIWVQIDIDFLAKRGIPMPDDYFKVISSMHFVTAADYTIKRFSLDQTPEEIMDEWRAMAQDAYQHTVQEKPFVLDYLQQLKRDGVRMIAATASEACFILPALTRLGMLDFFEDIVYASEVKRGKGFPDIYLEAARRMGVCPCDCTVFEDILAGVQGAKMADFFVIGVEDAASVADKQAIIETADQYITDFCALCHAK